MAIFGIGFRLLLVALAVAVERIGTWMRSMPALASLAPWLERLIASEPPRMHDEEIV